MLKSALICAAIILVLIGGIWAIVYSRSDHSGVAAFNERLYSIQYDLGRPYLKVRAVLDEYARMKHIDPVTLDQRIDAIASAVTTARTHLGATSVPPFADCRELQTCILAWVDQASMSVEILRKAAAFMRERNPGRDSDVQDLAKLLTPMEREDRRLTLALQAAQAAMAKQHGLSMRKP